MFLALPPAPPLAAHVLGYWFVEDLPGEYQGRPIRTSPHPGAVLSIQFGRPNAMVGGPVVPRVSLLGLQSAVRNWQSWSETYFVMVMLTLRGLTRLFPATGPDSADKLIDMRDLLGDRPTRLLGDDLEAAWTPQRVTQQLDSWLLRRLEDTETPVELHRLAAAHDMLCAGHRVQHAAAMVGVTRRQLHRWYRRHTGMGPKQAAGLARLQASVRAVQRRSGDPTEGFSDQAHQVRTWRRRLGTTPGRYGSNSPTPLVDYFGRIPTDGPAFYL